jgi:pimeloyl-ACP methyl ester carboxylesterase
MVDIGSHRLHLLCEGSGSPTVVIDSGLGALALEWRGVQRELAAQFTTCLYDRAGYGWSEPGPQPRTTARITEELALLLERGDVPGPYVLVGHSFGGYTAQLFARRFPERTAGVVLVEASHPEQVQRFLDSPLRLNTAPSRRKGRVVYSGFTIHDGLPDEVRQAVYAVGFTPKARLAMTQEYLWFRDSAAEVAAAGPMPDRPLVVLARGRRAGDPPATGTARDALFEQIWLQLQHELAASAPRAALLVAERSSHQVHLDEPELVVDAVAMVADFARAEDPAMQALKPAAMGWLTFSHARWLVDRLHAGHLLEQVPGLGGPEAMPAEAGSLKRARHYRGSDRPQFQLVVYSEEFEDFDPVGGRMLAP